MMCLRVFLSRLFDVLVRGRRDSELTEEIDNHIALLADEHIRQGMTHEDAWAAAKREFGQVELVKETYRNQRGVPHLGALVQDVRFAVRMLLKDRTLTYAVLIALVLGIGAINTVFTIVDVMVLRGLPVDDPHNVMRLTTVDTTGRVSGVSYLDYQDWRDSSPSFENMAAHGRARMTIRDDGISPDRFRGTYISANGFRLLGEEPVLGRSFLPDDDALGASPVVLLGHSVWKNRYAGDPNIVGQVTNVNGIPATIIGVMRDSMRFPAFSELWQPLAAMPDLETQSRDTRALQVFGRLVPDANRAQAQSELETIGQRLASDYPDTNQGFRPGASPFTGGLNQYPLFGALVATIAFALAIVCANVATLLLTRSYVRSREIAVRVALGATRAKLLRQLMVECGLLAVIGTIAGLVVSWFAVRLIARDIADINLPYWMDWTMDGRGVLLLLAACIGTVLTSGLVPALQITKANVSAFLNAGTRGARVGRSPSKWMRALVMVQFVLAIVLLAGAGLMMKSFVELYRADRVLDTSGLIAASVALDDNYETPEKRSAFYEQVKARLDATGEVASTTIATSLPFSGAPIRSFSIEGSTPETASREPSVSVVDVGADYFETLDLPLLRGSGGARVDYTAAQHSAVVNTRFVEMYFPNEDPLGRRIRIDRSPSTADEQWVTIVGISPTLRQQYLRELDPVVYRLGSVEASESAYLFVRSALDLEASTTALRESVASVDRNVPVYSVQAIDSLMQQSRWGHRVFGAMFAALGGVALVICAIGLYSVIAYGVTQRSYEIGVRMAFGANGRHVLRLILRNLAWQLLIAFVVGVAGALAVGRVLSGLLVQTTATDLRVLASVGALLVIVAAVAHYLPWRDAMRLDPSTVLRE